MITSTDHRARLTCSCGCQQSATLPHFRVMDTGSGRKFVLPGCWDAYANELAAQQRLREIVTRHQKPLERLWRTRTVYRMLRRIHERRGARQARKTACRGATVYLLGTRMGLMLSNLWT